MIRRLHKKPCKIVCNIKEEKYVKNLVFKGQKVSQIGL